MITKFGIYYSNDLAVSGSFAFDPIRKVNFRLHEGLDEWRIGGSWLFRFGIVNVNFGRNEFDDGGTQTNYSIGTFAPLSKFGVVPWGIQMFPMAGYTYNDGDIPSNIQTEPACKNLESEADEDLILVSNETHSGYLGLLSLKQISDRWTAIAVLNGSIGTNDYSGIMAGGGVALQATKRQSVNLMGIYADNSYGQESKAIVAYNYQFN